TTTWSGTWKQTGNTLALDLALAARTCAKTRQETGLADQQLPCRPIAQQLQLQCTSDRVARHDAKRDATGITPGFDVWRCHARAGDLDRTPRTWTLGKTTCVKTLGGRGGPLFEPC